MSRATLSLVVFFLSFHAHSLHPASPEADVLPTLTSFQKQITLENINRLNEERVVFHSFHMLDAEGNWLPQANANFDSSLATLLVITRDKLFLLKDGAENDEEVQLQKKDYWKNEIAWQKRVALWRDYRSLLKRHNHVSAIAGDHHPSAQQLESQIYALLTTEDQELSLQKAHLGNLVSSMNNSFHAYGPDSEQYLKAQTALQKKQEEHTASYNDLRKKLVEMQNASDLAERPVAYRLNKFYRNVPDSKPDEIVISRTDHRHASISRREDSPDNWVESNYGQFYREVRNRHVRRYVNQYKDLVEKPLLWNAQIRLKRWMVRDAGHKSPESTAKPEAGSAAESGQPDSAPSADMRRFATYVEVLNNEGIRYIALDADGDEVTETFLVFVPGVFNWGVSGFPTAIAIYNNQDPEIKNLISDLARTGMQGHDNNLQAAAAEKETYKKNVLDCIEVEEELERLIYSERKGVKTCK